MHMHMLFSIVSRVSGHVFRGTLPIRPSGDPFVGHVGCHYSRFLEEALNNR
jgi:hypothetical protein